VEEWPFRAASRTFGLWALAPEVIAQQNQEFLNQRVPRSSPSQKKPFAQARGFFFGTIAGTIAFDKSARFGSFLSIERLGGFGNGRDGHSHAGDSHGELRTLPRRWVRWKPLYPLFIHSGEVCFLKKDDSGTHNPFDGSAGGFEDGRHILQALSGLFLNRFPNNLPGYGVVRPSA
jgi:hypothetical protein